jgi:hypothetical protein
VTVQNIGCCDILVRFVGQVGETTVGSDQTRTFNVTPPAHFQAGCPFSQAPFDPPFDDETLTSNTTLSFNSNQLCG